MPLNGRRSQRKIKSELSKLVMPNDVATAAAFMLGRGYLGM